MMRNSSVCSLGTLQGLLRASKSFLGRPASEAGPLCCLLPCDLDEACVCWPWLCLPTLLLSPNSRHPWTPSLGQWAQSRLAQQLLDKSIWINELNDV